MGPSLHTIPEVVDALRLSRSGVYNEIRAGRLPVVHIGRRTFVTSTALARYIAELERPCADEAA